MKDWSDSTVKSSVELSRSVLDQALSAKSMLVWYVACWYGCSALHASTFEKCIVVFYLESFYSRSYYYLPKVLQRPNIRLLENLETLRINNKSCQLLNQLLQESWQLIVVTLEAQLCK
jgi:hypothetical protein